MQVLWGILDLEQPDTQTLNNIVISSVELIYCYAECLALHGKDTTGRSVAPAVLLFKKLLFSPNEAVRTSSRLQFLFFWPIFLLSFIPQVFKSSCVSFCLLFQPCYIIKIAPGSIPKANYVSNR